MRKKPSKDRKTARIDALMTQTDFKVIAAAAAATRITPSQFLVGAAIEKATRQVTVR